MLQFKRVWRAAQKIHGGKKLRLIKLKSNIHQDDDDVTES